MDYDDIWDSESEEIVAYPFWDNTPEEIHQKIFTYLPINSLLVCKCAFGWSDKIDIDVQKLMLDDILDYKEMSEEFIKFFMRMTIHREDRISSPRIMNNIIKKVTTLTTTEAMWIINHYPCIDAIQIYLKPHVYDKLLRTVNDIDFELFVKKLFKLNSPGLKPWNTEYICIMVNRFNDIKKIKQMFMYLKSIDTYQYKQILRQNDNISILAAQKENYQLLKFLHTEKATFTCCTFNAVIETNNVFNIMFMQEILCPFDVSTFVVALGHKNHELCMWLVKYNCPISQHLFDLENPHHHEIIEYLINNRPLSNNYDPLKQYILHH